MTKTRIQLHTNTDGSVTVYVGGKKAFRGTAAEAAAFSPEATSTPDQLLTATSYKLFCDLANDAGNWSGEPMLGGNVGSDAALRGNIADLKKKGLITTFRDEGCTFVQFTDAGVAYAASLGITL